MGSLDSEWAGADFFGEDLPLPLSEFGRAPNTGHVGARPLTFSGGVEMAVLGNDDYGQIRESLYKAGFGKEELKALPNLPNEAQLKAAFQVMEDLWTNNAATVKTNIETALGRSITAALARKIGRAWLEWKTGKGG
jgi:succinylarginine dihydrolase